MFFYLIIFFVQIDNCYSIQLFPLKYFVCQPNISTYRVFHMFINHSLLSILSSIHFSFFWLLTNDHVSL
jgi:hypothetical protein